MNTQDSRALDRLFPEAQNTGRLLALYYEQLNAHRPLRDELGALSDRTDPADIAAAAKAFLVDPPQLKLVQEPLRSDLIGFAARWCLPRNYGAKDVWWSLDRTRFGEPLELAVGPRSHSYGYTAPLIEPPTFPSFAYDPAWTPRAELRAYAQTLARQLLADIGEQADDIESKYHAGGLRVDPRRQQPIDELVTMARRLFRAAVLREPWGQIADSDIVTIASVRSGVLEWARVLDVPLPTRRPGRPPSKPVATPS